MQNYHPKERGHAKVLARRYFRTDKPWSQFQLAEGDPLSNIQQYDIKLKNFLDEHGKDPKKGVSVEEALIGIGCPKPWYREENEIYSFVLRKLSDWYNRRYLQVLSNNLNQATHRKL